MAQLYIVRAGELYPTGSPLRGADDYFTYLCSVPNHSVDAALPLCWTNLLPICILVIRNFLASKPLPDYKS